MSASYFKIQSSNIFVSKFKNVPPFFLNSHFEVWGASEKVGGGGVAFPTQHYPPDFDIVPPPY